MSMLLPVEMQKYFEVVGDVKCANVIIHDGKFKTSEIMSIVIFAKFEGGARVFRSNDIYKDLLKLLGDGEERKLFPNGEQRENGILYSVFGLEWKYSGMNLLKQMKVHNPEEVYNIFDKNLVYYIDCEENEKIMGIKIEHYTFSQAIESFNSPNEERQNENFVKALEYGKAVFDNELQKAISKFNK